MNRPLLMVCSALLIAAPLAVVSPVPAAAQSTTRRPVQTRRPTRTPPTKTRPTKTRPATRPTPRPSTRPQRPTSTQRPTATRKPTATRPERATRPTPTRRATPTRRTTPTRQTVPAQRTAPTQRALPTRPRSTGARETVEAIRRPNAGSAPAAGRSGGAAAGRSGSHGVVNDRYDRYDRYRPEVYRDRYDGGWYDRWRRAPYPRWYPGRPGLWIEVVYVRSPDRWRYGSRAVRCSVLGDELENAHDEWHWRNDRYRGDRWYVDEHHRLMRALDREWERSGCGRRPAFAIACRDRGRRHPRTSAAVIVALEVLDILLDGHVHH